MICAVMPLADGTFSTRFKWPTKPFFKIDPFWWWNGMFAIYHPIELVPVAESRSAFRGAA